MAKYKVVLVREECISCENCAAECADSFEMADDEFAHLKSSTRVGSNDELETDDLGCCKEAAEACPVNVIHVFEGDKQIV